MTNKVSSYKQTSYGYWILIDDNLYVDYESPSFKVCLQQYLKTHNLNYDDLFPSSLSENDKYNVPLAFGNFYDRTAFILYNTAEINEVSDLLSNYFKQVYRSDQYQYKY